MNLRIEAPELFGGMDGVGPVQVKGDHFLQYPDLSSPDFLQARDAQFNALFTPVSRELNRRFGEEMELLQGRLTNAGLINSPAGMGAIEKLQSDQRLDLLSSLERASDQAAAQVLEQGVTLEIEEGRQLTELRLGQAQMDLTAQVESARNLLEMTAQSIEIEEVRNARYLGALGIDAQLAIASRDQFLEQQKISLADLQRQDDNSLATLSLVFNTYLAELAAILNASSVHAARMDEDTR